MTYFPSSILLVFSELVLSLTQGYHYSQDTSVLLTALDIIVSTVCIPCALCTTYYVFPMYIQYVLVCMISYTVHGTTTATGGITCVSWRWCTSYSWYSLSQYFQYSTGSSTLRIPVLLISYYVLAMIPMTVLHASIAHVALHRIYAHAYCVCTGGRICSMPHTQCIGGITCVSTPGIPLVPYSCVLREWCHQISTAQLTWHLLLYYAMVCTTGCTTDIILSVLGIHPLCVCPYLGQYCLEVFMLSQYPYQHVLLIMRYMVGRVYRHHPHEMVWLESTPHPWDALVCVLPGYTCLYSLYY